MHILFISRKYPPQKGGMENYSKNLFKHLPKHKSKIVLTKSQKHLWWFSIYAFFKALTLSSKLTSIHLGDAALAPLGRILKSITKKPFVVTAHGLDITYRNSIYQRLVVSALKQANHIVAVSSHTKKLLIEKEILESKITVIPNGLDSEYLEEAKRKRDSNRLEKLNIPQGSTVLLTVGRLVERKGHAWFVKNVLPELPQNAHYICAGNGPEKSRILEAAKDYKTESQVHILENLSNNEIHALYAQTDFFIMPNQQTNDSVEGFGIVAIEAATHGLPVIASSIEGITDAVSRETGYLVNPNKKEFATILTELISKPSSAHKIIDRAPKHIAENFHWEKLIKKYTEIHKTYES